MLQAFKPTGGPRRQRAPRAKRAAAGAEVARIYWCAECRTPVATESDCIDIAGAHQHTFTNPADVRFTIGCFRAAAGCRVDGEPTLELTWFAGYAWSYASCTNCRAHLGWCFEAAGGARFFGLILARLLGPI